MPNRDFQNEVLSNNIQHDSNLLTISELKISAVLPVNVKDAKGTKNDLESHSSKHEGNAIFDLNNIDLIDSDDSVKNKDCQYESSEISSDDYLENPLELVRGVLS